MFGLGKKQDTPRTSLVITIGSSSVRASLVLVRGAVRPLILTQHKEDFISEVSSFKKYIENMQSASNKVIERIVKSSEYHKPFQVYFVLERPWYQSQSYTFTQESEHEFVFKHSDVIDILKKHAKDARSFIEREYFGGIPTEIIEKKVVHLALNGYEVESVARKVETRKIDITTYLSFTPKLIIDTLESTVSRHIHTKYSFATSQIALFVVGRDILEDIPHSLLVSVGDDHSEVSFVENGALLSLAQFPVGEKEILKHTRDGAHTKTLLSHLKASEKVQVSSNDPHQKILASAQNVWQKSFGDVLEHLSKYNSQSDTILLLGDKHTNIWVKRALEDSRNNHFSRSGSGFRVILVSMNMLDSYVGSKIPFPDLRNTLHAIFATINS